MERFCVDDFIVDPGRNVIITPGGGETRLEPKVMDVLLVLAGQPGEVVSRDTLIERVWGVEYGADEGPTRAISILRKVFSGAGNGSPCIETIPKRGYRLTAPVRAVESGSNVRAPGDVAAPSAHLPVMSEARGAAPAGARPDERRPVNFAWDGSFPAMMRRLPLQRDHVPYLLAFAGLVLIAGVFLAVRFMTAGGGMAPEEAGPSPAGGKIVAVVPFVNRSTDKTDAFLADGFHETLLTQLSKISGLEVISRTSMLQYQETKKPVPRIAQELGAAVVMEGSVQRSDKRVRINVQLIDGARDTHLWAEIYDVDLTPENLFAVQSDISRAIARALETVLTDTDQEVLAEIPTRNPAAYEAYLRGRVAGWHSQYSRDKYRQAIAEFDESIRLDPDFAEAYSGKALAHVFLFYFYGGQREDLEAADRALTHAERLGPDATETLLGRAYYHYWGSRDPETAHDILERARKQTPNNVEILSTLGWIARARGRFDESLELFERVRRLDPFDIPTLLALSQTYPVFGRFREAEALIAQAKSINPTNQYTAIISGIIRLFMGAPERAWEETSVTVIEKEAQFHSVRCMIARLTGDVRKLESALAEWPEELREPEWSAASFAKDTHAVHRAWLLEMKGQPAKAQALFTEIEADLKGRPEWRGWLRYAGPYFRRDLETIRNLYTDFQVNKSSSAWQNLAQLRFFAQAFARAGDSATALDLMESYTGQTAPSAWLQFAVMPDFASLRDHPRYLALKARYEQWATENGYQ